MVNKQDQTVGGAKKEIQCQMQKVQVHSVTYRSGSSYCLSQTPHSIAEPTHLTRHQNSWLQKQNPASHHPAD